MMITGIGTPSNQSKIPRPIFSSFGSLEDNRYGRRRFLIRNVPRHPFTQSKREVPASANVLPPRIITFAIFMVRTARSRRRCAGHRFAVAEGLAHQCSARDCYKHDEKRQLRTYAKGRTLIHRVGRMDPFVEALEIY
jgi:hypothetical protein